MSLLFRFINFFRSKGRPCVLIIDDDPDFNYLVSAHLKKAGLYTVCAGGGEQGLQVLSRFRPHVILLDIAMPGLHGFDVLKVLKLNPRTQKIPVIMLTSRNDDESKVRSERQHVAAFITKTADFLEFEREIRKVIGKK